ncbi:MAG: response regulator transcription factor [Clostridia bacterium]
MSKLIYVTDDDLHIRQLILSFLRKDGFEAVGFERGEEMMTAFAGRVPDLVVLDIMLPGMDGLGICTLIRQQYAIPIMLVSAKDSELDRITGITLGGDDYMVKPFSPIEMVVRVKALLRRTEMNYQSEAEQKLLTFGNLTIDTRRHAVTIGADVCAMTPTEFDFLRYMIENSHRAISKAELLRELWHFDNGADTRATDDLVKRLRRKLRTQGSDVQIETVWGFGYRLSVGETP